MPGQPVVDADAALGIDGHYQSQSRFAHRRVRRHV